MTWHLFRQRNIIPKLSQLYSTPLITSMPKYRVSILIPCYNGVRFIDRAFQSIINQTENNIEVIFVDDGSTDDSLATAQTYVNSFELAGHNLRCLHKPNGGAASAIKEALEVSVGKYIMPFDIDDELHPDACKTQADFLDENCDCTAVLTNGYRVIERDGTKMLQLIRNNNRFALKNNIFEGLLSGEINNIPGMYMISGDFLRSYYSKNSFLITRFGQNLQLLLPSSYDNLVGYIAIPLLKYYIHLGSHSNPGLYDKMILNLKGYRDIRYQLLKDMGLGDEKYSVIIELSFLTEALHTDARFHNRESYNEHYRQIKAFRKTSLQEKMEYHYINGNFISYWYRLLLKIHQICKHNYFSN